MKFSNDSALMHTVLDGEATPAEEAALSVRLAQDPAARDEFDRLQQLFTRLGALSSQHPPEGMFAAIDAQIRPHAAPRATSTDQLSGMPGVLGSDVQDSGDSNPNPAPHAESTVPPVSSSRFYFGKNAMSETNSLLSNRKVLVGGGIAIAAAAIALTFGLGTTPSSSDVTGTIVPAERYRAQQVATADIPLGDQSLAQLLQNDAFLKLIKDPQVQALVLEPDFVASSKLMLQDPEAAKKALAGTPDPAMSASLHAAMAHQEAARMLLAYPEANRAIFLHPTESMAFIPNAQKIAAERAQSLDRTAKLSPDAALVNNANLAPDAGLINSANRVAPDASLVNSANRVAPDASLVNSANRVAPDASLVNSANRVAPDASLVNRANRAAPDASLVNSANRVAPDASLVNSANRAAPDASLVNSANRVAPDASLINSANRSTANRAPDASLVNNANRVAPDASKVAR